MYLQSEYQSNVDDICYDLSQVQIDAQQAITVEVESNKEKAVMEEEKEEGDDDLWDLPDDLKYKNDLGETREVRWKALRKVRQLWEALTIGEERDGEISDKTLIQYLRGKKYNYEKVICALKNKYKFHRDNKHLVEGANVKEFDRFAKFVTILPNRTLDGKLCLLIRPRTVIDTVFGDDDFRLANPFVEGRFMVWLFNSISDNIYVQVCGVQLLLSMKDITFWEAYRIQKTAKLADRALALKYLATCTAARFGGMMAFDNPYIMTPIFYVVTLFLSAKLKGRMHLCGQEYKRVFEKLGANLQKIPVCIGGKLEDSDCEFWVEQKLAPI